MASSLIERLRPHFRFRPRQAPGGPGAEPAPPAGGSQQAPAVRNQELVRRRDELARRFAELQWDLGGLTYEMAIRDHIRLDLVVRQAAELQAVDAELAAAERMLHMDEAAAAGTCGECGALYARGAVFCWQCGHDLMPRADATAVAAAPAGTPVQGPTSAERR